MHLVAAQFGQQHALGLPSMAACSMSLLAPPAVVLRLLTVEQCLAVRVVWQGISGVSSTVRMQFLGDEFDQLAE